MKNFECVLLISSHETPDAQGSDYAARAAVARRIATFLGCAFGGEANRDAADARRCYFVPDETLLPDDAAAFGIRSEDDLFGGVVPHAFIATKALTHGLVNASAAAPVGWSHALSGRIREAVLEGYTAFSLDDARTAVTRLLRGGSVRIKRVLGIGGVGQYVARDRAAADTSLMTIGVEEISEHGVVIERNLEQMRTYSIGQLHVGDLTLGYVGMQRTTPNHRGCEVYGGSDLRLLRGGFAGLRAARLTALERAALARALIYDAAIRHEYPDAFASRRNYDVIVGRDEHDVEHYGVLEQSWRFGGASAAEVAALLAFQRDPRREELQAATHEIHADVEPPHGAELLFRGVDARAGPITKYCMVLD